MYVVQQLIMFSSLGDLVLSYGDAIIAIPLLGIHLH